MKNLIYSIVSLMAIFLNCEAMNILDAEIEKFKSYPYHKAMVVAIAPDGSLSWGLSWNISSQTEANDIAFYECNKNRIIQNIKTKCKLYIVDDNFVYNGVNINLKNDKTSSHVNANNQNINNNDLTIYDKNNLLKQLLLAPESEINTYAKNEIQTVLNKGNHYNQKYKYYLKYDHTCIRQNAGHFKCKLNIFTIDYSEGEEYTTESNREIKYDAIKDNNGVRVTKIYQEMLYD